ncbi:MAG: hypothetical protein LBT98_00720 [Puniceicoccales bacterium]|jgi:tyrosine-specific transport protein|nr:hypothetical protein [Puniceicoccales bacterium]
MGRKAETRKGRTPSPLRPALLIAGIAIGAGELGLPAAMAPAGYWPALLGTLLVYGATLASGLLTVQLFLKSDGGDLPSLFRRHLGRAGAAIFNGSYFTLALCLLVAYWSGLLGLIGRGSWGILAVAICGNALFLGLRGDRTALLGQCNAVFVWGLVGSFLLLLAAGLCHGGQPGPVFSNWAKFPRGLPVILCSFGYHQVIPLVCEQLRRDRRRIHLALALGTALPLFFAITLFTLAFRLFSQEELCRAAGAGLPLFALLRDRATPEFVFAVGRCFSILAIVTSLIALSLALRGAMGDVFAARKKLFAAREVLVLAPLPIALLFPHLFLSVLGLCGGIFGNLIAGILPLTPFLARGRFRLRYLLLWSFFVAILAIELFQLG